MKSALISVSNKNGVCEFAAVLAELGYDILSTGGTAKILRDANVPVTDVSAYTEFPEMMDGRVKTLHPMIHGGILGRRGQDDAIMAEHGIRSIDIVVVNLYPFQQTIADPDCSLEMAIENIDIGGPSMVRAAAKNYKHVAIVVDPGDYLELAENLKITGGELNDEQRFKLATKAFAHTAQYDGAIANYLSKRHTTPTNVENSQALPDHLSIELNKHEELRYGENPHQRAAFYRDENPPSASIGNAKQIHGKPLSYNNIADTDAAIVCAMAFENPACCIVKHANPCGVTEAKSIADAYEGAYLTDPTSAFGGIIAFNRELDADTAERIVSRQFVEVIAAPAISPSAKAICEQKKDLRLLEIGPDESMHNESTNHQLDFKRVTGGFLIQDRDQTKNNFLPSDLKIVSKKQPTPAELSDLMFAWVVVKCVKSNAIVYAKNRSTIGVGAGQMSRVYSARVAALKAADEGLTVAGSVMASDAFFPFRDGIDAAAEVGISAVIQPGGSKRDAEVIAAADEHGMVMVFTGMRHFRH